MPYRRSCPNRPRVGPIGELLPKNWTGAKGGLLSLPYLERRYGMLTSMRKTYDTAFKAKVAFEAAKAVV